MNVKTFESNTGKKPVDDFFKSQDQSTIAKISHKIDMLEQFGKHLGMPYSKKITNNLYELRIRGKVEIRILYGFKGDGVILLHAFNKKKDKIATKDIKTASVRLGTID